MGRYYDVPFVAGTVTAAGGNNDLWTLKPADDKPIHIVALRLGQISEVGDAAEEGIDITIEHLAATVTDGSGGSSVTPSPADNDVNVGAGFTARINDTTVATTSGTKTIKDPIPWNNRQTPLVIDWPEPESRPTARQGSALVIRMNTTIADDMTFSGSIRVEED